MGAGPPNPSPRELLLSNRTWFKKEIERVRMPGAALRRLETMAKSEDRRARRESLEHELQNVRSMIRALRQATGNAQPEHGVMFELERAEEKQVQILEALAALDRDPD